MTYTDDFSIDRFMDGTYTAPGGLADFFLIDGTSSGPAPREGTEFEIASGELKASSASWQDVRGTVDNTTTFHIEVHFADTGQLALVQLGFANVSSIDEIALALGNNDAAFAHGWGGGGLTNGEVVAGGAGGAIVNGAGGSQLMPATGAHVIALDWDGTTGSIAIDGTEVLATTGGSGSAVFAGGPIYPFVQVLSAELFAAMQNSSLPIASIASASDPVVITDFVYTPGGGSAPPLPSFITVAASPDHLPADGTSTSTVTATILDALGVPMTGESPAFAPAAQFGAVTNNGDGTYAATYTATTVEGTVTVGVVDGDASGSAEIVQGRASGSINAGTGSVGIVRG